MSNDTKLLYAEGIAILGLGPHAQDLDLNLACDRMLWSGCCHGNKSLKHLYLRTKVVSVQIFVRAHNYHHFRFALFYYYEVFKTKGFKVFFLLK